MLIYISLIFTTLGFYVAVMLTLDSIVEVVELLFLPIFLFVSLSTFCVIGQHLKDSVCIAAPLAIPP